MKPLARTDQLLKQTVEKEIIVYDETDDTACCLNELASRVWRNCDGHHSVNEIAEIIAKEMDIPSDIEPEQAVWHTLEDLEQHNLIASFQSANASQSTGISRRQVFQAAMVGLALFPTIKSIVTPTPAMAGSGTTTT